MSPTTFCTPDTRIRFFTQQKAILIRLSIFQKYQHTRYIVIVQDQDKISYLTSNFTAKVNSIFQ